MSLGRQEEAQVVLRWHHSNVPEALEERCISNII